MEGALVGDRRDALASGVCNVSIVRGPCPECGGAAYPHVALAILVHSRAEALGWGRGRVLEAQPAERGVFRALGSHCAQTRARTHDERVARSQKARNREEHRTHS